MNAHRHPLDDAITDSMTLAEAGAMVTAANDQLPAYGSLEDRWASLSAQIDAALTLAAAYTDFPPAVENVRKLRARFNWFKRQIDNSNGAFREAALSHALGQCGPNGMWPAIDEAMSSARYHGFNWRERARAVLS